MLKSGGRPSTSVALFHVAGIHIYHNALFLLNIGKQSIGRLCAIQSTEGLCLASGRRKTFKRIYIFSKILRHSKQNLSNLKNERLTFSKMFVVKSLASPGTAVLASVVRPTVATSIYMVLNLPSVCAEHVSTPYAIHLKMGKYVAIYVQENTVDRIPSVECVAII